MNVFSKQDYELINLGVCIKQQAERLGIEHEGVPLEGVVVRIAVRALSVVAEEPEWEREVALHWLEADTITDRGADESDMRGVVRNTQGASEVVERRVTPWVPVNRLAEVHAAVISEEPEWEYSWAGEEDGEHWILDEPFETIADALVFRQRRSWISEQGGVIVRRRKAGEWTPVEEEGEPS